MNLTSNKITGKMHTEITPEFIVRVSAAFADTFGNNSLIVLNFPDFHECMSLKFAMLSGLCAAGAKVYNLCGLNERGAAKFAVRHLHAVAAINVSIEKDMFLAELLNSEGAAVEESILNKVSELITSSEITYVPVDKTHLPVNVNDITDYYLKDIIAYTSYKRLNFSIGICTNSQSLCDTYKRLGSLLGIKFLFINHPDLICEMIESNNLNFAIQISQDGRCFLIDDSLNEMDKNMYWQLVTLVCGSASRTLVSRGSTIYVPKDVQETLDDVAKVFDCNIIRIDENELEEKLLKENNAISRLEYALYTDPVRAVVRICEFLYLNSCALSEVVAAVVQQ